MAQGVDHECALFRVVGQHHDLEPVGIHHPAVGGMSRQAGIVVGFLDEVLGAGPLAFFVFAILAPLVMFTPKLARAKKKRGWLNTARLRRITSRISNRTGSAAISCQPMRCWALAISSPSPISGLATAW
jgi:hypothetical protein